MVLTLFVICVPLVFVVGVLVFFPGSSLRQWLGLTGILGLVGLVQLFWIIPVRKIVKNNHGEVCGNCLFILTGLDQEGICPECGEHYTIAQTRAGWEKDFRTKYQEGTDR